MKYTRTQKTIPGVIRPRALSTAAVDAVAPPLPAHLAELGALPVWGLCDETKIAVRFDGRRPWGGVDTGDQGAVNDATARRVPPPRNVLRTYDDARRGLAVMSGRTVALRDEAGPMIDGLSVRFVPTIGVRLVGLDLDGVIDADGRVHEYARAMLDDWGTFAEVSVSGKGIHAYGFAWIDDDLPDGSVALQLGGDGGEGFVPWPKKTPSAAIYCGRTWRHFRWSGVGFGRFASLPVTWCDDVVRLYLRGWFGYRPKPEAIPQAPLRAGTRTASPGWWQRVTAAEIAARMPTARYSGSRWYAVCPTCRDGGRQSSGGPLRPSLRIWDDADGIGWTCPACKTAGRAKALTAHLGQIAMGWAS
jgi:hypothetical protein